MDTSSTSSTSLHEDFILTSSHDVQSTSDENDDNMMLSSSWPNMDFNSSIVNRSPINTSTTDTAVPFSSGSSNGFVQNYPAFETTSNFGIDQTIMYSSFDVSKRHSSDPWSSPSSPTPGVYHGTLTTTTVDTVAISSETVTSKTSIGFNAFSNSLDSSSSYELSSRAFTRNLKSTKYIDTSSISINTSPTKSGLTGFSAKFSFIENLSQNPSTKPSRSSSTLSSIVSSSSTITSSAAATISSSSSIVSSSSSSSIASSSSSISSSAAANQNDQKVLATALGSLGTILVLLVVGSFAILWWRSRKRKIRSTLMKLRTISQQTQYSEDPPDICLDVNSFNFAQLDEYDEPDVTSHTPKRILSAHEDALNFSKEDFTDLSISGKRFSQVPSNRTSGDSTIPYPNKNRVSFSEV